MTVLVENTKARPKTSRKRLASNIALQAVAMVALGFLLYSPAANWFSARNHNSEISGYLSSVADTSPLERTEKLDAAYLYNDQLQPGPLTDPYQTQSYEELESTALYKAYLELLRLTGTDAIGTVTYPQLSISLPIYHGTSDQVIRKGVGHMFGTSLPVGGPSTHSVLTAHSGLPQAKLFSNLMKAEVDDIFWISVLGEQHYYRVRSTETVLPGDTESLKIFEGEDLVTLFTCTPIGVNSHRFLVLAERTEAPDTSGRQALPGDGISAGFPWWAVAYVLGSAAIGWVLFAPPRKKRGVNGQDAEG